MLTDTTFDVNELWTNRNSCNCINLHYQRLMNAVVLPLHLCSRCAVRSGALI